jgi:hypothetical protein
MRASKTLFDQSTKACGLSINAYEMLLSFFFSAVDADDK